MNFEKHVLKNGIRVLLIPTKDTQTVAIEVLVEAGSKYENKKNNGISHFLEHMMFKGTKKRPSTKIIAETFDNVGGEYNAFTGKEQTGYWAKVPAKHFEMALDVVSDIYQNPLLKQKDIDTEKGVILQEIAMYKDMPNRYIWDIFENLLYGDQPAGWDIAGKEKNVKDMQRADFLSYMNRMYLPKTTVVTIAGKFDKEKTLESVQKYFSGNKSKLTKKAKKKVLERQKEPALKILTKKTDQTHLLLGFRGPNMFSKERFAAVLLGTVLGGGMSSRTFINIRERHGLAYYMNSATDMTTDTGYVFAAAGVEHKNLEKAVSLILKEMEKLKNKKISQKELRKAKEYLKGKTLMSLESTTSVTSWFGEQELFRKKVELPEKMFKELEKVTSDDIQRIAQKVFVNEKLNLAVIGPWVKTDQLKSLLKL